MGSHWQATCRLIWHKISLLQDKLKALLSGILKVASVNIYSRGWFLSGLILCQIDLASSLNKNSKLCVFVTNKHELLRRQPVIISTPTQTHNWQGADAWKDEQHHLYRTIRGWLFSSLCAFSATCHFAQSSKSKHTTPPTAPLPQSIFPDMKKQGRERKEEADSSRRLRSRAQIVPAGGWGWGQRTVELSDWLRSVVMSFFMVLRALQWKG